jgi:hypothetical protein
MIKFVYWQKWSGQLCHLFWEKINHEIVKTTNNIFTLNPSSEMGDSNKMVNCVSIIAERSTHLILDTARIWLPKGTQKKSIQLELNVVEGVRHL